jgi:uncharacterized cupin superfamily protein
MAEPQFSVAGIAEGVPPRTTEAVVYVEVGDRTSGDQATWPDADLQVLEATGRRHFAHRDSTAH